MLTLLNVLAQRDDSGAGILGSLIYLVIIALVLVGWWKVFTKAGKPGWYAIIPILNTITLIQIAGRPWWWFLLLFIPIVNFVIIIIVMIDLAKRFGKGTGFGLGLAFLNPIFMLILGFSDAQHRGVPA